MARAPDATRAGVREPYPDSFSLILVFSAGLFGPVDQTQNGGQKLCGTTRRESAFWGSERGRGVGGLMKNSNQWP